MEGLTRSIDSEIWLIGKPYKAITGMKLPSRQQVLARLFYLNQVKSKCLNRSVNKTANEVILFWRKARIPIMPLNQVIYQMKELHEEYKILHRNKDDESEKQQEEVNRFVISLKDLFDIANPKALDMIFVQDDRQFLLSQRKPGREGSITSIDVVLKRMKFRDRMREERANRLRVELESEYRFGFTMDADTVVISSSESESEDHSGTTNTKSIVVPNSDSEEEIPSKKEKLSEHEDDNLFPSILTPELVSTLDKYNISNEAASAILTTVAHTIGYNDHNTTLCEASINNVRLKFRKESKEII